MFEAQSIRQRQRRADNDIVYSLRRRRVRRNLQNIPILMGAEIRNAFVAPPGYLLVNADYSQLELRVAAFFSRDDNLMKAFVDGKDIHRWVAALMFEKPEEDITSFERYLAKYLDFGVLYGRSAQGITEGWEAEHMYELSGKRWTLREAQDLSDSFFEAFPKLRDFITKQGDLAIRQQFIESPTGRRRRFPFVDRSLVGSIRRKAVNTPIQGTASDMTLSAVIRLTEKLPETAFIVSSVHDSIMLEIPEEQSGLCLEIIRREMEIPCIAEFDVPLRVDIGVGTRWGELKE